MRNAILENNLKWERQRGLHQRSPPASLAFIGQVTKHTTERYTAKQSPLTSGSIFQIVQRSRTVNHLPWNMLLSYGYSLLETFLGLKQETERFDKR